MKVKVSHVSPCSVLTLATPRDFSRSSTASTGRQRGFVQGRRPACPPPPETGDGAGTESRLRTLCAEHPRTVVWQPKRPSPPGRRSLCAARENGPRRIFGALIIWLSLKINKLIHESSNPERPTSPWKFASHGFPEGHGPLRLRSPPDTALRRVVRPAPHAPPRPRGCGASKSSSATPVSTVFFLVAAT